LSPFLITGKKLTLNSLFNDRPETNLKLVSCPKDSAEGGGKSLLKIGQEILCELP
jgi:hypothetical protein